MVIELVAAGAAGCFVYYVVQRERSPVLRRIRTTPRFTAATVPDVTQARLVGIARALDHKSIEAPLTGRPCLCYVARMLVTETSGTSQPVTRELNCEIRGVKFELVDDSGAAIIDPEAADAAFKMTSVPECERTNAFRDRYKLTSTHGVLSFYEGIIEPYQRIAVAGFGQREASRLTMRSSPHLPLAITNAKRLAG
jgi:hypothetical protein